jgi:hypothetical protein
VNAPKSFVFINTHDELIMTEIISCAEAKALGLKRYFTGEPCKHGHVAERNTSNNGCLECTRLRKLRWRAENPDSSRKIASRYYAKNADKIRERKARYYAENADKERERERKARHYAENADKVRERNARWRADNADKFRDSISRWRAENADKVRERKAQYRAENAENISKYEARWRAENPDKVQGSSARYRVKNADKLCERRARYRAENAEELRERGRRYRAENPEKSRAHKSRRRAIKLNATVEWGQELTSLVELEAFSLAAQRERETGFAWHVDHMIPLQARKVSGLHVWNNLQVIPAKMNLIKQNRLLLTKPGEWLRSR